MRHRIIVKWNEKVTDKEAILPGIQELFAPVKELPGIQDIHFFTSCVDRPNRFDLAIAIDMEEGALEAYDVSEAHKKWKETYTPYILSKTIFDCEMEK